MKAFMSLFCLLFGLTLLLNGLPSKAWAVGDPIAGPPTPAMPAGDLIVAQIKVTGEEFIVLQNNGEKDIPDLSLFSIKSISNVNPSSQGATSSVQHLPAVTLGYGERLLLSTAIRPTCGATVAGKLSLSFLDSGGSIQILRTEVAPDASPFVIDSVSWSALAAGDIANMPSNTKAPESLYYRYSIDDVFKWQQATQDIHNLCLLTVNNSSVSTGTVPVENLVLKPDLAPATITMASSLNEAANSNNSGLIVPQITEILPNPLGSGNDVTEEFIELYNPNEVTFDLSSFTLQTGISSLHDFTFSAGTVLPAKSFTAFYSADTGLSLSNSGSKVRLLDPSAKVLVSSDTYGTAQNGRSWALANGRWYWSLSPTPALANIITLPPSLPVSAKEVAKLGSAAASTRASKDSRTAKLAPSAKHAKSTKSTAPKQTKPKSVAITPTASAVSSRPIQFGVVALVATLALLYGAYEYRADLANAVHKFRGKFKTWRRSWR